MNSTALAMRTYFGLMYAARKLPQSTARAVEQTNAVLAAMNTVHGPPLPDVVSDSAVSCVLSPSSARNTTPNVMKNSFQSMVYFVLKLKS